MAKALVGIVLLVALAGGANGMANRLGSIFSILLAVTLGLAGLGVVVLLLVWWLRSEEGPTTTDSASTASIRPEPAQRGGQAGGATAPRWGEKLRALDWYQFEKLMEHVYRRLGHAVERKGGAKPDGGVDLMLLKDGNRVAVQCKHWRRQDVGVRQVREFVGALKDSGVSEGTLVTLNGFTREAKELAQRNGVTLFDEKELLTLLASLDLDYDPELQTHLTNPEKRCPKCESRMTLRTAGKGPSVGERFWGCSTYPRCRFTLPL